MIAFKFSGYLYLLLAVVLGITSNGLLKTTNGFTNLLPTLFCIITIILCLFCLSKAMEMIPVGFAYATYGGLTITAVTIFAILKYNQLPNIYGTIGIVGAGGIGYELQSSFRMFEYERVSAIIILIFVTIFIIDHLSAFIRSKIK